MHVPANAVEAYKSTAPWSSFGNIVAITNEEMGVELLITENSLQTTYDLQGRKVIKDAMLKNGIYIVNGKKVIVK